MLIRYAMLFRRLMMMLLSAADFSSDTRHAAASLPFDAFIFDAFIISPPRYADFTPLRLFHRRFSSFADIFADAPRDCCR